MKITTTKAVISALLMAGTLLSATGVQAAPPGGGWDDVPDVVVGGGSDTTYLVSQRLEVLYNGAPGCTIQTGNTAGKGACSPAGQTTPTNGNFDHDIMVSATPTGSGAGVNALLPTGVQYTPAIDFARSSRGASGTEANDVTFWGYARDGIAVLTFGTRSGVALSKQDLIDIYTCAKTDWSQFGGAAGTIIPWNMNSASGTRSSFYSYLGIGGTGQPAIGSCVRAITAGNGAGVASGTLPFENDVKPILADKGPDGSFGTADDDENNYIWWMSFGNWLTYPFTKNGKVDGTGAAINSNTVAVDGLAPTSGNIFDSTYPLVRTLYMATRETDADCNSVPGTDGACNNVGNAVYGGTSGKGGAVRQFTQWLCSPNTSQHATNPVTGANYRNEIVKALNTEGFQQLATSAVVPGLRSTGYACAVQN